MLVFVWCAGVEMECRMLGMGRQKWMFWKCKDLVRTGQRTETACCENCREILGIELSCTLWGHQDSDF